MGGIKKPAEAGLSLQLRQHSAESSCTQELGKDAPFSHDALPH